MNLDNIKQYIYTNERTKVNTKGRKASINISLAHIEGQAFKS